MLFGLNRTVDECVLGTRQWAIDGAAGDFDTFISQRDALADRGLGNVRANSDASVVDVALADPQLFLDDRNGFFVVSFDCGRVGRTAGPIIRRRCERFGRSRTRPALRLPGLGALVNVDAAIVIKDVQRAVVQIERVAGDSQQVAAPTNALGIGGAIVVGEEEFSERRPEALGLMRRRCRVAVAICDELDRRAGMPASASLSIARSASDRSS